MPRNIERDKREADRRKNQLIEAGFRLFSQNGIETVSLQKVADAANVSPATMYKYFLTKEKLLIAISAKVWDEVWQEALGDPGTNHFEHFTAYQGIEFYADRMIALYKNRPEVLRFSGEYKTYMNRRGNMEDKQLREHLDVLKPMQLLFHGILTRNTENSIQRIDKKAALPMLCQQSYRPCSPIGTQKTLALVNRLGSSVPLYRLGCNMEPEAALVAYHEMNHE